MILQNWTFLRWPGDFKRDPCRDFLNKLIMKRHSFFAGLFFLVPFLGAAQADTINAANGKLQTQRLKEGTKTYLVYFTDSLMNRQGVGSIWVRKTDFIHEHGQDLVRFSWDWIVGDSLAQQVTNLCDRKTLAPLYHYTKSRKRGVTAWKFEREAMVPDDTVADNNAVKRGRVQLPLPVISWEQDLETYPLLPIRKTGQVFDIAFFDPNETEPSYHRYTVAGKEPLLLNNDTKVNCWILRIDYGNDAYALFWLTETSKEVIRMKEYFNGRYRFKVKLY